MLDMLKESVACMSVCYSSVPCLSICLVHYICIYMFVTFMDTDLLKHLYIGFVILFSI